MPQCKTIVDGAQTLSECQVLSPRLWDVLETLGLAGLIVLFTVWIFCALFWRSTPENKSYF